jgi:ribosomal protein L7Ae-like RNA K-turn-binding protein
METLSPRLRVVGELVGHPSVIVETSEPDAERVCELVSDLAVEVVELRRHIAPERLPPHQLAELVAEFGAQRRLAVGAEAVERAIQRRRLELLVAAADLSVEYSTMLRAVLETNCYTGPMVMSELTREKLGKAAGSHRAGCVGLLRGERRVLV